jgi:mannose-1-phosphate guanylyltransferase/mannose-6-phosphate isomerase
MYTVILCGGSGTRLWPLSRKNFPKQFLSLYSDKSLLQETYLRMREIMPSGHIFFVTNYANFFNVFNQIKELEPGFPEKNILSEPESKNTAPAIALAVKYLAEKEKIGPDEVIVEVHSDHYIGDKEKFLALVKTAAANVGSRLGTIGITPAKPDTGLGYIHKGKKMGNWSEVLGFQEKPDLATAEKYVASGEYAWNAGMYLFTVQTFESELKLHAPEIHKIFSLPYDEFLKNFSHLPSVAIDVAVSEKTKNLIVFEGEFGWSDVGSFDVLAEILAKQKDTDPRHVEIDCRNVFVHSANSKLIATLGLEDVMVVENNDCILVLKKGKSGDVRKVVEYLKEHNHPELEDNVVSYRPWGKYEMLVDEPKHKVRKITVYSGASLNLHSHQRRAEHWVVVKGAAKIVNGDRELILNENESTFIPKLARHRLENPGKINLEIIEVQTGDYLGEDDIERFDDQYNR